MKMQTIDSSTDLSTLSCDAAIVGQSENGSLDAVGSYLDGVFDGWLSGVLQREEQVGKPGDLMLLAAPAGSAIDTIAVVGVGDSETLDCGVAYRAGASAIRALASRERASVLCGLGSGWDADIARAAVSGVSAGIPGQDLYRAEQKLAEPLAVSWVGLDQATIDAGTAIGDGICTTKRLVNEPPNVIFPASFADETEALGERCGFEVEVWDKAKLEAENCASILAVSAGSQQEPRLVIMRHNGGPADEAPVALVGKGVTFDSGGLSLKPSEGMKDMKCDMGGAATVLGAMVAISQLKLKKNVIGLVGLAENMVSGNSYKLGDVIRTRNGKTIEILNTDAEGRVVLADTLDVTVENEPSNILDLATLTGACLVALGMDVAGVMTNNDPWCQQVKDAAAHEDEKVWELPMWDFYSDQIKSKVADIKNIGEGRWGGSITAGKFLEEFVGDIPWAHLDIAGPAFADSPKPWRDAGGTGAMVRTLVRLIESI